MQLGATVQVSLHTYAVVQVPYPLTKIISSTNRINQPNMLLLLVVLGKEAAIDRNQGYSRTEQIRDWEWGMSPSSACPRLPARAAAGRAAAVTSGGPHGAAGGARPLRPRRRTWGHCRVHCGHRAHATPAFTMPTLVGTTLMAFQWCLWDPDPAISWLDLASLLWPDSRTLGHVIVARHLMVPHSPSGAPFTRSSSREVGSSETDLSVGEDLIEDEAHSLGSGGPRGNGGTRVWAEEDILNGSDKGLRQRRRP
jgi:hypothetical protein